MAEVTRRTTPSASTASSSSKRYRSLVASARRVRFRDAIRPRTPESWQNDAWRYFDEIGEVQNAITYHANHLAKARIFPALVPSSPKEPPQPDSEPDGQAAIDALRGPNDADYSEIIRSADLNLLVPGECWLVGRGSTSTDQVVSWEIRSIDEVDFQGTRALLRDEPGSKGTGEELSRDSTILIRIWNRHPRFSSIATSPMRGILASCEEVARIERVIRGAARSRSAVNGILTVPDELSFGNLDMTTESEGDGESFNDPFTDELINSMVTAIADEGSAAALVPIVVRGPAEFLRELRKIDLAPNLDTELVKLERALTRLAQGLPVPPEIVTGKADLNHWTAWSVDENAIEAYFEPALISILGALTTEYYRPFLEASGMSEDEARRRMLWFDVTPMLSHPNRGADADYGLEHIAISDKSWRSAKGFTEDDAPTIPEIVRRLVLQRGSFDPTLTTVLLDLLGVDVPDIAPPAAPPTPRPTPPSPDEPIGPPSDDDPPSPSVRASASSSSADIGIIISPDAADTDDIGARLLSIDVDLRTRLHAAADAAVRRALERANATVISRLRNDRRYKAILESTDRSSAARSVGVGGLREAGLTFDVLFANAFDALAARSRDWMHRAFSRAFASLNISRPDTLDLDADIQAASDTFVAELTAVASSLLLGSEDPDLDGERDDHLVPYAVIRSIPSVRDLLPSVPHLAVDGWEWVYGERSRTRDYDPHAGLDGHTFSTMTDAALSNANLWPAVTFLAPGDHPRCQCEARPVVIPAADPADVPEAVASP